MIIAAAVGTLHKHHGKHFFDCLAELASVKSVDLWVFGKTKVIRALQRYCNYPRNEKRGNYLNI